MSLGFARDHRSSDAYVRCLRCRSDLKVGSRGISTYLEHCRGVIHHKLDCLVRSRRGLFLRRRTGAVMSATGAADLEEELRGLSLPDVKVWSSFSVREVFAVEARDDSIWDLGVETSFYVLPWTRCTGVETSRASPICGVQMRVLTIHTGACSSAVLEKRTLSLVNFTCLACVTSISEA